MIKIRDLHNLIDLVEKASLERNELINVSIGTSLYGGLLVDVGVFDRDNKDGKMVFQARKIWSFFVERENSSYSNAATYKDCRDYLKNLFNEVK